MSSTIKKYFCQHKLQIFLISKYLFSVVFLLLALTTHKQLFFLFVGMVELLIIALITDILLSWKKWAGYSFNALLLLIFNIQNFIMYFAGTYTTLVMVTNLESLESQSGRLFPILIGVVLLLVFSFLPIASIKRKCVSSSGVLSVILLVELAFTCLYGNTYSPTFAVYRLGLEAKAYQEQLAAIADQPNTTAFFYQPDIKDARKKPDRLPEKPNVILIFTEGLSQNIISDERRPLPNIQDLQKESLDFSNYYNHTFATYRGLIGQLYSGYQLDNYDNNTLISMEDILANKGYQTTFINVEPNNIQFVNYLENLHFQTLVNDTSNANGINGSLTDQAAFELLYDTIEEQSKSDQPFFTAMYTYGTHMSFDSPDKKYGDGSSILFNRFYNFDYYFNEFMTKFKNSPLAENTILVFTADHATFEDRDFTAVYPDYPRANSDLDTVPFFIYHKGVEQHSYDVQGRNSLSLTPTILDYLDISEPNYFLGDSLFYYKENNNSYDTVFYDNAYLLSTDYGTIAPLQATNEQVVKELLDKYFAAKTQLPMTK